MAQVNKISMEVPSETRSIRKVSSRILEGLSSYGLDADTLLDIRLCAEEAVRNAIVHGNRSNKNLPVKINYWVEKGRLNIEVEDEGAGFNPDNVPDPRVDKHIMRESGRGVHLIRELMDKVDFNEKGNKIRMEKTLWQ